MGFLCFFQFDIYVKISAEAEYFSTKWHDIYMAGPLWVWF